ncbi:hypothetical protein RFI_04770 [Reticulomyxa filosa]|uniref:Uncharacterized protein n=1 Tax=Reticulomyxa filosa TaxID=46433 RepID=X6P437_RETFI|nr:hypothetical protein RFI_04770 [Reticulomyxa filosa]|eukprot:ETO32347.1 hypothetical protein RFI_04770 [Reticulomyxa filosa]
MRLGLTYTYPALEALCWLSFVYVAKQERRDQEQLNATCEKGSPLMQQQYVTETFTEKKFEDTPLIDRPVPLAQQMPTTTLQSVSYNFLEEGHIHSQALKMCANETDTDQGEQIGREGYESFANKYNSYDSDSSSSLTTDGSNCTQFCMHSFFLLFYLSRPIQKKKKKECFLEYKQSKKERLSNGMFFERLV